MAQAVSRRPFASEVPAPFQATAVRFVVDKVDLGQVFTDCFGFPLSVSFC
jgi:hypothetical protein